MQRSISRACLRARAVPVRPPPKRRVFRGGLRRLALRSCVVTTRGRIFDQVDTGGRRRLRALSLQRSRAGRRLPPRGLLAGRGDGCDPRPRSVGAATGRGASLRRGRGGVCPGPGGRTALSRRHTARPTERRYGHGQGHRRRCWLDDPPRQPNHRRGAAGRVRADGRSPPRRRCRADRPADRRSPWSRPRRSRRGPRVRAGHGWLRPRSTGQVRQLGRPQGV